MNPNLEIRVEVILPHHGKRLCAAVRVAEHVFAESFAPLPRDRELPFAIRSQQQAARQKQMRRHIARTLGEQLAHKILELIEAEDPQQGYSPEEWRRINSANDGTQRRLPPPVSNDNTKNENGGSRSLE